MLHKLILFLLLLSLSQPRIRSPNLIVHSEVPHNYTAFVHGLAVGLDERTDPAGLRDCLYNNRGREIIQQFLLAFHLYTSSRSEDIERCLQVMLRTAKFLLETLEPCMVEGSFGQLRRLQKECGKDLHLVRAMHWRYRRTLLRIAKRGISDYGGGRSFSMGTGAGRVLKKLWIDQPELNLEEFTEGFVVGAGDKGDAEKLLKCVKQDPKMISQFTQPLHDANLETYEYYKKSVKGLLAAGRKYMAPLKRCDTRFPQVRKIRRALDRNVDTEKIARRITRYPNAFLRLSQRGVISEFEDDSFMLGKVIAKISRLIFLS